MHGKHTVDFGDVFTVLEPVGQHSERQGLRARNGFISRGTVGQDPRQLRHFANPSTVFLSLDVNREITHDHIVQLEEVPPEIPPANGFADHRLRPTQNVKAV